MRESVQGENPVPGSERILDLVSHTFALPNGIDRDNGILLSILSISIDNWDTSTFSTGRLFELYRYSVQGTQLRVLSTVLEYPGIDVIDHLPRSSDPE